MALSAKPSRWRWNPIEEHWEVDQGHGWHESRMMQGQDAKARQPYGASLVTWSDTKHEERAEARETAAVEMLADENQNVEQKQGKPTRIRRKR